MEKRSRKITLFDIRKIETKRGTVPKVQLAKDVEVFYKGKKVDFGEYNSAFLKTKEDILEHLEFLVSKDYISSDEMQSRLKTIEDKKITGQLEMKIED